jgi:hypothetical protein
MPVKFIQEFVLYRKLAAEWLSPQIFLRLWYEGPRLLWPDFYLVESKNRVPLQ